MNPSSRCTQEDLFLCTSRPSPPSPTSYGTCTAYSTDKEEESPRTGSRVTSFFFFKWQIFASVPPSFHEERS